MEFREENWFNRATTNVDEARKAIEAARENANNDPQLLAQWIYGALLVLEKVLKCGRGGAGFQPANVVVTYEGKDIDLVEYGMALWLSKEIHVNGKPATQEFIREALERIFGVNLDNWHGKVQDMKNRKKDPTHKLSALTQLLLTYLGKLTEDRPARR